MLRYFTWRIAVVVRIKRRKYAIGNVKIRYNDIESRDAMPFVDSAVKPPDSSVRIKRGGIPKMATNPRSMVMLFSPCPRDKYTRIRATMQHIVK